MLLQRDSSFDSSAEDEKDNEQPAVDTNGSHQYDQHHHAAQHTSMLIRDKVVNSGEQTPTSNDKQQRGDYPVAISARNHPNSRGDNDNLRIMRQSN